MDKLKNEILKFKNDRGWGKEHKPKNLAISISLEAAELLEHFQWGDDFDVSEVQDELADVLIYCFYMADVLGVDVSNIIREKLIKQTDKYPVQEKV